MRRCLTDPHYWKNPALKTLSRKNCLEPNFSKVGSWFFSISKMETFKKMFEIKATWCSLESFLLLSHPRIKSPPHIRGKVWKPGKRKQEGRKFWIKVRKKNFLTTPPHQRSYQPTPYINLACCFLYCAFCSFLTSFFSSSEGMGMPPFRLEEAADCQKSTRD